MQKNPWFRGIIILKEKNKIREISSIDYFIHIEGRTVEWMQMTLLQLIFGLNVYLIVHIKRKYLQGNFATKRKILSNTREILRGRSGNTGHRSRPCALPLPSPPSLHGEQRCNLRGRTNRSSSSTSAAAVNRSPSYIHQDASQVRSNRD